MTKNGPLNLSRKNVQATLWRILLKIETVVQHKAIVREMLKTVDVKDEELEEGTSIAKLMVRDVYANYNVHTRLDIVTEGKERRLLLEEFNRNIILLVNMKRRCPRQLIY